MSWRSNAKWPLNERDNGGRLWKNNLVLTVHNKTIDQMVRINFPC